MACSSTQRFCSSRVFLTYPLKDAAHRAALYRNLGGFERAPLPALSMSATAAAAPAESTHLATCAIRGSDAVEDVALARAQAGLGGCDLVEKEPGLRVVINREHVGVRSHGDGSSATEAGGARNQPRKRGVSGVFGWRSACQCSHRNRAVNQAKPDRNDDARGASDLPIQ